MNFFYVTIFHLSTMNICLKKVIFQKFHKDFSLNLREKMAAIQMYSTFPNKRNHSIKLDMIRHIVSCLLVIHIQIQLKIPYPLNSLFLFLSRE